MKQVELAQQLGISKSYLSMILSGQRTPNPELARRLNSLGVVNFKAGLLLEREVSS
jgi:transcriptional regulator with XRE-family HTH domain